MNLRPKLHSTHIKLKVIHDAANLHCFLESVHLEVLDLDHNNL